MKLLFQFSRYSLVAVSATASDWVVFTVLEYFFGVYYLYAQIAARIMGGLTSFFLSRHWTFSGKDYRKVHVEARRFLLLYLVSYSLSICSIYALADHMGLSVYLAKALADGTCFVFNFIVMKLYVFNDRAGFTKFFKKLFYTN